jgi:hypothetical protein
MFGGFSFSKPAEPEAPAAPAAEPAKKEESSSSMFSSDMWNTPIKVWGWGTYSTRMVVLA